MVLVRSGWMMSIAAELKQDLSTVSQTLLELITVFTAKTLESYVPQVELLIARA